MTIDKTLSEREQRYGDFTDVATTAQALQDTMRAAPGWARLDPVQRQGLTAISDKIGRILSGDPNYPDNWHDIAGYATIIEQRLPAARPTVPPGFTDAHDCPETGLKVRDVIDVLFDNGRIFERTTFGEVRGIWNEIKAYRVVAK